MLKIAPIAALSLLALALAGCQQPQTPNVASYDSPNTASSGICGVVGDCPTNTAPYPMEGTEQ